MPRNLRILNPKDNAWFLNEGQRTNGEEGYPISYLLVICYAFREYLSSKTDYDKDSAVQLLKDAIDAMQANKVFKNDNFLEIYPLMGEAGYVVVDQSDGCFPLMLYPSRPQQERYDRGQPFIDRLKQVCGKIDDIGPLLFKTNYQEWTEEFQKKLLKMVNV